MDYPRNFLNGLAGAGLALFVATPAMAETTLRAIVAFPQNLAFAESFKGFTELLNERGAGVVQIQILGGPEMFPPGQQIDAVNRGIVDMQYGPITYAIGTLPEAYAFVGGTVDPVETRSNGGLEIMREAMLDKLGVYLLGRPDSDIRFYIYTIGEPKRTGDGGVDLSGMQLRSLPIYNAFFESLGAVPISVPVPDVYTGLERNTFDGLGFPLIGVQDLSWDNFLKYRIDPGFFQGDLTIVMNPKSWENLSPEAQELLTQTAADWEQMSAEAFGTQAGETAAALEQKGITTVTLEGEAREKFLDAAYDTSWRALEASGSAYYDRLRAAFYDR
ncbi:MAG: TRAP transporter substrate-binding protein DctP [Paracoccus sp. (in: a-proteobacteria)]|nr:TRAP transporter substrate-binding protein DctP [Paracoccus sp. (in: a-proteobacteria)]